YSLARGRVLHGIRQEVVEHDGDDDSVRPDDRDVARGAELYLDPLLRGVAPIVGTPLLDQAGQLGVFKCEADLGARRVAHQLAHGVGHQIARVRKAFEPRLYLRVRIVTQPYEHEIDNSRRDGQEVVERVRGERDGSPVERR